MAIYLYIYLCPGVSFYETLCNSSDLMSNSVQWLVLSLRDWVPAAAILGACFSNSSQIWNSTSLQQLVTNNSTKPTALAAVCTIERIVCEQTEGSSKSVLKMEHQARFVSDDDAPFYVAYRYL